MIQSRAQKRQDINFPSSFLNRIIKKSIKVSKKDKTIAEKFIKEADSNFKYAATISEYDASYRPEQFSLPTILKKLASKGVQAEPKTVYEILYTQDERDLITSSSETIQVIKLPKRERYRVDRLRTLPSFSEICKIIEGVLFRRISALGLNEERVFYKRMTGVREVFDE